MPFCSSDSRPAPAPVVLQSVRLTCPRCGVTRPHSLTAPTNEHEVQCIWCLTRFTAHLLRVTESRWLGGREWAVLGYNGTGAEECIGVASPRMAVLPLRPGDMAAFTASGGRPAAVRNLTLDRGIPLESGSNVRLGTAIMGR